jgi:hypothetical protein
MDNEKLLFSGASTDAYVVDDDILFLTIRSGEQLTTEESQIISTLAFTHFKGKYKVLTVPQEHASIEADVRSYLVTPDRRHRVIADAIVITNLPHRLLADFYMKFNRPDIPTQFFKTYKEALVWLRSL